MIIKFVLPLFITSFVFATDPSEALTNQIIKNKPEIKKPFAKNLAKEILKASKKYKVPANLIAAIYKVESNYILEAVNERTLDYGIGQINQWHVKKSKLSKCKILTNLTYSVDHSVRILKWFYDTYPLEEAIARYNCGIRKGCINW